MWARDRERERGWRVIFHFHPGIEWKMVCLTQKIICHPCTVTLFIHLPQSRRINLQKKYKPFVFLIFHAEIYQSFTVWPLFLDANEEVGNPNLNTLTSPQPHVEVSRKDIECQIISQPASRCRNTDPFTQTLASGNWTSWSTNQLEVIWALTQSISYYLQWTPSICRD